MTFTQALRSAFRQYARAGGRSSRSEFWWFLLFFYLCILISVAAGSPRIVQSAVALALICPFIAVGIRRLHDINMRGWWYLPTLIPLLGFFWTLYIGIKEGDSRPNRFGPPPLT